jgi:hypothetical protein
MAVLLVSCNNNRDHENPFKKLREALEEERDKVNTEPQSVSITDVFSNDYDDREVLEFWGYIGQIPTTVSFSGGTMNIRIFERRHQSGGSYLNLDMPLGADNNEVEKLPAQYKQEDLRVHTKSGKTIGVGAKVKIRATDYYSSGDYYSMEVISIEAVGGDGFDNSVFSEAKVLTSAVLADTSIHEQYSYMDGTLSIPTVFYSMDGTIGLDFKTSSNSDIDEVDIAVGEGPSTMDMLPSSYTSKDLKVRDADGNPIKPGAKVRVYGTWERYSFVSSTGLGGRFYVEEVIAL